MTAVPMVSPEWRSSKSDVWTTNFRWRCNAPNVVRAGIVSMIESGESNRSKLLLFGGTFRRTGNASDLTYTYDLDLRQWNLIRTVRSPHARAKPLLVSFCNSIILFGGYYHGRRDGFSNHREHVVYGLEDLWMYDIRNKTWYPVKVRVSLQQVSSSFLNNSRVVSMKWNTSCRCNDMAIVFAEKTWSWFWKLQLVCSSNNRKEWGYEWVFLRSQSDVHPKCGVLHTLASATSDYDIYGMNCKSELWRLSLLTLKWINIGSVTLSSAIQHIPLALALFLEPKNEYVLLSKHWSEVYVYSVNNSQFRTEPCEGTWITENYFYSYQSSEVIFFDGSPFPLIYFGATAQCWQELWSFEKEGNSWKWRKLGEPLLAPFVPQYYDTFYRILGNEASIQSFTLFENRVYVFVKHLTDRWISERQSDVTVFGPQVWSVDLSTMTWWSNNVVRSVTHEVINSRWCGSLWFNNILVISTFTRCTQMMELWSYDITKQTWTKLDNSKTSVPQASCGHSLVAINSATGLLFGGITFCEEREVLCKVWKFEIQLEGRVKWSLPREEPPFCNGTASPQGTYGHSAVTAGDQMLVYGGIVHETEACRNELWSYNISTASWQKLNDSGFSPKLSPSRLCSCSAAATNYTMWLAILCDSNIQTRCFDSGFQTWMYLITLKMWILLSESHLYESWVLSNMAFLDSNTLAMFDPYHASFLTLKAGCPKGFASIDVTSTPCHVCDVGTFSDAGESYCKVCPRGLTTQGDRSYSILNCSLCLKDFCRNGRCLVAQNNGVPGATCLCNIGYSGLRCDNPVYILIGVIILVIVAALSIAIFKGFAVWKDKKLTESTLLEELRRMSNAWQIQRHEIDVGRRLGSGAFGDVFEAQYRGITVAIKVLREWEDSRSSHEFEREILFMQTIRHPNIVLFLGSGSSVGTKEPFLVLEYMSRGTLRDLLYNVDDGDLSMDRKLSFAVDAARGMQFLHGLNPPRIHRDLKSANLLVSDNWVVKVSDFGLGRTVASGRKRNRNLFTRNRNLVRQRRPNSRRKQGVSGSRNSALLNPELELSLSNIGTARWCAPELLSGQEYDTSVDVFRYII